MEGGATAGAAATAEATAGAAPTEGGAAARFSACNESHAHAAVNGGNDSVAASAEGSAAGFLWMGKQTHKIPLRLFATNRAKVLHEMRRALRERGEAEEGDKEEEAVVERGEAAGDDLERFRGKVVLVQGGESTTRYCSDHEPLFRQESYFAYLFGVTEPDFFGAIDLYSGRSLLFVPRLPESYAVWLGEIQSLGFFKARYGVDDVFFSDSLPSVLASLTTSSPPPPPAAAAAAAAAVLPAASLPTLFLLHGKNTDSGKMSRPAAFEGIESFPQDLSLLHPVLSECRVIKSQDEIAVLKYVAAVSSAAHVEVMRRVKGGMMEYELEAMFEEFVARRGGCRRCGYCCICATGSNSAVLHYGHAAAPNDKLILDGDIALLDMGGEYFCYGADITCSFPVNGKFTPNQRVVYEAVLAAQQRVIAAMRPGVKWTDMHLLAEHAILGHLAAAGLLNGCIGEMMERRLGAVFMPHGLGHFLGLDTHDVGGYNDDALPRSSLAGLRSLRTTRTLRQGMVITVEPGCYFIDAVLLPAMRDPSTAHFFNPSRVNEFRGMGGVRLEDDVLVTENGVENFTFCPREVAEVEAVMAGADWPINF